MLALMRAQPAMLQRYLDVQARLLAEAMVENQEQVHFSMPDRIVCTADPSGDNRPVSVPPREREQIVGSLLDRLSHHDLRVLVSAQLTDLERSNNRSVVVAASLLRFAIAAYLVHEMLPAGRSVTYTTGEGEEIPAFPASNGSGLASAITAATDAIVETNQQAEEVRRGDLQVPYVPAALHFFLPQWVAFDEQGNLLVSSVSEAEAYLASMQHYTHVLHVAVGLAPYVVADPEYQHKRYGILGQLVNQGRQLACFLTGDIIQTIHRRANRKDLNRGLSISLPFFDDQQLAMRALDFEIIPAGRIMFVPAFVVRAAHQEQAKVAQDTRLNYSTRKYLMVQLKQLEQAFDSSQAN